MHSKLGALLALDVPSVVHERGEVIATIIIGSLRAGPLSSTPSVASSRCSPLGRGSFSFGGGHHFFS